MKLFEFADSVDPDEPASSELPNPDLHYSHCSV